MVKATAEISSFNLQYLCSNPQVVVIVEADDGIIITGREQLSVGAEVTRT